MNPRAAALHALMLILEAIRGTLDEAGEQGAPAGVIYTALMARFPTMTAEDFNRIVKILTDGGVARREGHVLYTTNKIARA